ncbi:hypothetical protein [Hippea sp. KM1]|uniref:hypothetical protein n=1 Tax=Hippea sp. KM1 TaxID=944481 RepID=UPI00046D816E|nr:hypothetical protein [Hippea sp. KM1]
MKVKKIKINNYEIFEVCFEENDNNLKMKIKKFAEETAKNTYKRSGMDDENHKKNIIIGKMAEEAFSFLVYDLSNKKKRLFVNYDNKVDKYDFKINNETIDIKSSSMKTKNREYTLIKAIESFNFTLLLDQNIKDIIVQTLYKNRDNFNCFYFFSFELSSTIIKKGVKKYLKMNGNSGYYYLYPIKKGKKIEKIIKINND